MYKVLTQQLNGLPPVDDREVWRYAGMRIQADKTLSQVFRACLDLTKDAFLPKVAYCELPKDVFFDLVPQAKESKSLPLASAEKVVLFVATVGVGIDRLITKYTKVAPIKALFFQALGAERIEQTCDVFCANIAQNYAEQGFTLGRRFSPGYGDFSLLAQRNIFKILSPEQKVGVTLTDSLMMSPTKSVSAVIPIMKNCHPSQEKSCKNCMMQSCAYKRD